MPPRQVYGRRANTTASTYTKLISPDKEDGCLLGETGAGTEDVVEQIGQQLKTLKIEAARNVNVEEDATREKPKEADGRVRRRVAVKVEVKRTPRSLELQDVSVVVNDQKPKRGRKSRKVLESRQNDVEMESKRQNESKTNSDDICAKLGDMRLGTPGDEQTLEDKPHRLSLSPESQAFPSTPKSLINRSTSVDTAPSQAVQPTRCANDIYTEYVSSLLALSSQHHIVQFNDWSDRLDECVDIRKIAEASFSEVYRLKVKDSLPDCASESVLKVVALKMAPGTPLPTEQIDMDRPRRKADTSKQLKKERDKREEEDEWKSKVEDVHCEVRLLQNLNHIPGFTNFRELTIVRGRPSATFGQAWKEWNQSRPRGKKSEFPDPTKKASYEDMQLWAVIEMQDAGTDCGKVMEAGGLQTIWEIWDVFWGVCLSVAKAEEGCQFEHRDLHMDNICIRSTTTDACLTERKIKNPLKRKWGFAGLETTVIDYTLSRADIIASSQNSSRRTSSSSASTHSSVSTPASEHMRVEDIAYLDLNRDQALFEGDAEMEYQYEIYRYMRGAVFHNDPLNKSDPCTPTEEYTPETPRRSPRKHQATDPPETPRRSPRKMTEAPAKDIWKQFHPKTNLVWAHFILHSLFENISSNDPNSMSSAEIMRNIVEAEPADAEKIHKKAIKLHKILAKVAQLLEPGALGPRSRLDSCRHLIIVALEASWLSPADVSGRA